MAKIQINDVKLDGIELFNDSETFLNELEDSETGQIFGGLSIQPTKPYKTTVYIPKEPIHPPKPTHLGEPTHPKYLHFPFLPVIL